MKEKTKLSDEERDRLWDLISTANRLMFVKAFRGSDISSLIDSLRPYATRSKTGENYLLNAANGYMHLLINRYRDNTKKES